MILVLSGTTEGKVLAAHLEKTGRPYMATTVTKYGGQLLLDAAKGIVGSLRTGPLNKDSFAALLDRYSVKTIVDATHPYAHQITWLAFEQAQEKGIAYLRWQRPGLSENEKKDCVVADDYEHAAQILAEKSGKWLITTGSRHLETFCRIVPVDRMTIRIMPFPRILEHCLKLGFLPGQIIAQQGPFSQALNRLHLEENGLSGLVTKDSGETGGTMEKIYAAKELGLPVILINRPPLPPAPMAENLQQVLDFLLP